MKHCLITGGGSKFGSHLTHILLKHGYHVHLITSSAEPWQGVENVTVVPVDWATVSLNDISACVPPVDQLDLIFFNHNASSLSHEKFAKHRLQNPRHWQQSYFVACQFPYYLIQAIAKKIQPSTKIAWMLSMLIQHAPDDQIGFADYIGNKATNAAIMKAFSLNFPGVFFGVIPREDLTYEVDSRAHDIVKLIEETSNQTLNGNTFIL